ncbi:MAG: PAS domain S-box protein [Candidatus Sericytochromatia bacterium]|nr:PAS domain S-box protein [Candidatus Sericytochromatia bacterium]
METSSTHPIAKVSGGRFPLRLVAGGLIITLFTIGWLWLRQLQSYKEMEALRTGQLRSKELQGTIFQLDELLTMSARMAVATGNPQWQQRYLAYAPKLDAAIDEVMHLAAEPRLIAAAESLQTANRELVGMEESAMVQAQHGQTQASVARLNGPLYADLKTHYAEAAKTFHAMLDLRSEQALFRQRRTETASLIGAGLALFMAAFGGAGIFWRVHRWQSVTMLGVAQLQATEARLESLRRQHEMILNSAAEGIYGLDLAGCLTFVNPAAEAMLGWSRAELLHRQMHPILHHSWADGTAYPANDCPIYATLHDGRYHKCADEVFWRQDGTSFPVEYASNPICDGDRIVGAVVTFSDISERFEKERLKNETIVALSQAEVLKNQFLSMVSHELRTPVSVILSSANILSFNHSSAGNEAQQRHLEKIMRSSHRLMGLLSDLLDATQIEAGTFRLHRRPIHLVTVVTEALESIEHLAAQRHQRVERDLPLELPEIAGDPDRLVQVLSNLLHNASKFTPTGGLIQLSVAMHAGALKCQVQDTGRGIAADKVPLLFQRFSQLDVPEHSEGRSMGLGLFIGKALVEAHGGSIGVFTHPGAGSCFWFTLPLGTPPFRRD